MRYVVTLILSAGVATSAVLAAPAISLGNAASGKAAFAQCTGCHSLTQAEEGIGPSLAGVMGRQVASLSGYEYSKALQAGRGQKWTPALLDSYLANPDAMFPGNKMGVNVADPKMRADIIAYLASTPAKQ